ncbi:putative ankyrin repeat protein RF_0381 [Microplitis demolitor]|uniref:putative ankyrin repeat protein RF_0381 n=1 Tax=Microplitis demolitor TaxID=69319 RepID=UPI00235B67B5|nr:putative ankyrin repeat protein RF_0381 [Microplitis demolitor]XP_053594094.1 putative ankyrin repeat protein RF_0381 [Microplitis demolitor]
MSDSENSAKRIRLDRSSSGSADISLAHTNRLDGRDHNNDDDNLSNDGSQSLSSLGEDDYNLISTDESEENLTKNSRDSQGSKKSESDSEEKKSKDTRLQTAIIKKDIELVKEILSSGVDIDAPGERNHTALHLAVYFNDLPTIECLLEYGANITASNRSRDRSDYWGTPLHYAVKVNRLDIVKLLLTTQVDVNKLMKNYDVVLNFAFQHKNYKLIKCLTGNTENDTLMKKALNTFSTQALLKMGYGEDSIASIFGKYFDINVIDSDNHTPLSLAVKNKNIDMVEYLLDNGADINSKNYFGGFSDWTALDTAVEINDENIVRFLLNNKNCHVITKRAYYYTPLLTATQNNNLRIVKMLVEKIAQHDSCGKDMTNHVLPSFHRAVKHNLMEIAKYYLDTFNIDVNTKSGAGLSPLDIAANENKLEMFKLLVDYGAEIKYSLKDRYEGYHHGGCPLYYAVEKGNAEMVDIILNRGTRVDDVNKTVNGKTILHLAVHSGSKDIIERLLDRGVDINSKCNIEKYKEITPLLYAAIRRSNEIVSMLIEKGCDINELVSIGSKRIYIIDIVLKYYCCDDFFKTLLNSGADINFSKINNSRLSEEKSKIVEQHLLKLKAAKLFVHHKFRSWVSRGKAKKVFYIKCKKKVLKMKEKIINESTICYYDLLIKRVDQVAMFADNKDINEVLEFGKLEAKFPIYAEMLLYSFKRGQKRHQLLKEAEKMLKDIFIDLPYDCVRKILMYLNNDDLLRCAAKIIP